MSLKPSSMISYPEIVFVINGATLSFTTVITIGSDIEDSLSMI